MTWTPILGWCAKSVRFHSRFAVARNILHLGNNAQMHYLGRRFPLMLIVGTNCNQGKIQSSCSVEEQNVLLNCVSRKSNQLILRLVLQHMRGATGGMQFRALLQQHAQTPSTKGMCLHAFTLWIAYLVCFVSSPSHCLLGLYCIFTQSLFT